MQVLIFPTAGKLPYLNYVKTVEYAVDKIKFVDLLDPLEQELFLSSQRSHFGIWGVTDGNNNKNLDLWKQSEIGDTCLFYRNRKFYSKGKIFAKIENQNLSLQLWNKGQKGEIWKNIYFIEFLENIDIPISKLAQSVYAPGQSVIRTFQIIRSPRSAALLKICGEQIRHKSRKEIFAERIEAIGSVTDSYVDSKRRLEQDILVDYLFQDSLETPCAICSKLYPNEFLVAGHIKKRSLATSKERTDLNIVMPICKMGCDELYERGYIYVDTAGLVSKNKKRSFNKELLKYIKTFINQKSYWFNKDNAIYFRSHMGFHLEKP